MVWTTYKEKIKRLSQRIIDAQKPIRILDAVKWDPSIESEIRKNKFKSLPKVGPDYYQQNTLGFDPEKKIEEFKDIIVEIGLALGASDALGLLLKEMAQQYIEVVHMLQARGKKQFWEHSRRLYGSPKDKISDGNRSIFQLGEQFYSILSSFDERTLGPQYPESFSAQEVVDQLNERFKTYFLNHDVEARISDGIVADAAAGGDVIKIREGSKFSSRDVDILEVHEGWVHAGTSHNGHHQHVSKWLSKGPPRCTATQEGLAVLTEILSFRSYPRRARTINDRLLGIDKAEEGANILELIEFFRTEGYEEQDCVTAARRIFRGGVIEGGAPFTKDISYCRGFVENYNFIRAAIRGGKPYLIPFLFCGKLRVDDVPLLYQKYQEGIVDPPVYLPPQFKDLNGLAVWISFSTFLHVIDLDVIQERYDKLFKIYL